MPIIAPTARPLPPATFCCLIHPMLIDSHCHINFPELADQADLLMAQMRQNHVSHALCVAVNLPELPSVLDMAERYPNVFASVGVHPDYEDTPEPSVAQLVELAQHSRVIAIGETGLDYYRLQGDLEWQRERFRTHIRAARECGKPLIIHTRSAAEDTLRIMREENAQECGGVMHCFTETWDVAQAALDFSGRPYFVFEGNFTRERVGDLPTELVPHFFRSLCDAAGLNLHLKVDGENAHHQIEACFKALARALRQAIKREGTELPSTKGTL